MIREARAELETARTAYAQVLDRIQRESKRAAAFTYPDPASLEDIRDSLWEDEVLVLYTLLPGRAAAVVATSETARLVDLGDPETIRDACFQLLPFDDQPVSRESFDAGLAKLVASAVEPLQLPEGAKRILVSPDGALSYAPFALLMEDAQVACVPSGTTYRFLAAERELTGEGVTAFGDPSYARLAGSRGVQVYARGQALDPLPFTRDEVQDITREGDERILGEDATEAAVEALGARGGRRRAIHFACHGLVDPNPTLSALALTPDAPPDPTTSDALPAQDDGFLTALEIFRMQLPANLVVRAGAGRFAARAWSASRARSCARARRA
jgi:hypothetical protein